MQSILKRPRLLGYSFSRSNCQLPFVPRLSQLSNLGSLFSLKIRHSLRCVEGERTYTETHKSNFRLLSFLLFSSYSNRCHWLTFERKHFSILRVYFIGIPRTLKHNSSDRISPDVVNDQTWKREVGCSMSKLIVPGCLLIHGIHSHLGFVQSFCPLYPSIDHFLHWILGRRKCSRWEWGPLDIYFPNTIESSCIAGRYEALAD